MLTPASNCCYADNLVFPEFVRTKTLEVKTYRNGLRTRAVASGFTAEFSQLVPTAKGETIYGREIVMKIVSTMQLS